MTDDGRITDWDEIHEINAHEKNSKSSRRKRESNLSKSISCHQKTRLKSMDKQLIHRSGSSFVRVASSQGFVWVTNRLKVNDLNMSSSQRLDLSNTLCQSFQDFCSSIRSSVQAKDGAMGELVTDYFEKYKQEEDIVESFKSLDESIVIDRRPSEPADRCHSTTT